MCELFLNVFNFQYFVLDATKPRIIGQRKMIVMNPDGSTQIKQQNIAAPVVKTTQQVAAPTTTVAATTPTTTPSETAQKVQIIRGPDGKLSVRGLNPDQKLITMSDGKFLVLTTNANGEKTKTVLKSPSCAPTKIVTKPIARIQTSPATPVSKQAVIIRQQMPTSTTVISKPVTNTPIQRVSFIHFLSCYILVINNTITI